MGNPFGRAPARWMPETKLRALFSAGLTYDEVAEINERSEGWRPSRAAVSRKFQSMGEPARRATHRDLLPWKLLPEHSNDLLRHMLQAESRARLGRELSRADRKLTARLHELLFGRGKLMVVGYHKDIGFYLAERQEWDQDIIRHPRAPAAYCGESPLRKESAAAGSNDGGGSPAPQSGGQRRSKSSTVRKGQELASNARQRAAGGTRSTKSGVA